MRHQALGLSLVLAGAAACNGCHGGNKIEVLRASPLGQLTAVPGWVEVQFDKAIINPDAPDPKPVGLRIEVDPEVKGEARFPTPSSLTYTFAEALKPAQAYEITVKSGLKAAVGDALLGSSYSFSFTTEVNRLASIEVVAPEAAEPAAVDAAANFPNRGRRELRNLDVGERLVVHLALPAEVAELKKLVTVRGAELGGSGTAKGVVAKVSFPPGETVDRFLVTPLPYWPKSTKINVTLAKGLHVATPGAGRATLADEQVLSASTFGALAVVKGPECQGCRPRPTLLVEFSTPVACEAALSFMSLSPNPGELHCAGQANDTTLRLEPTPALQPFTKYTLTIGSGVTDRFGQTLSSRAAFKFETGDANARVAHQLMFNVLERKLAGTHEEQVFRASQLEVTGGRLGFAEAWNLIAEQDLTEQIAWTELPWWLENPYGYYGDDCYYDEEQGGEVCSQTSRREPGETDGEVVIPNATTTTLAVGDDSAWTKVPVPLTPFLKDQGGFVVLKSTPIGKGGKRLSPPTVRLLNVTDLGLSAKYSPNQLVVLVARLSDGKAVAGAKIEIYTTHDKAPLAAPAAALESDAQGLAVFPAAALTGAGEEPNLHGRGFVVVATQGDDQAFMWSSFQAGGQRAYKSGPSVIGKVYTERGVYRPGETVYYRAVVRRETAGGFATPAGETVHLAAKKGEYDYDGEGEEIFAVQHELSEFGTASGSFTVPTSAAPDTYRLRLTVGDQSLSANFLVAEFRRAELKVAVAADKQHYLTGDELTAKVNADYLFGAPASGLKMQWSLRRSWGYFDSARFPDALFSDYDYHVWYDERQSYSEFLDEGTVMLDDAGSFTLSRKLDAAGANGRLENLVIGATVDDTSGQSVSATTTVQVHPASFHVGLKPHGYLKDKGKVMTYEVIAVSPEDRPFAGARVTVSSVQDVWYSVQRKGGGGRMTWDYRHETLTNDSICSGVTNNDGVLTCQYTPKKGGSLRIRAAAKDQKGRETRASTWFWVTGDDDYYGGRTDGENQVGIMSDTPEVAAGTTARIAITSPFKKALALITVEREDILWRKVIEVGTNALVDVPVSADWAPNVYISATLVRGRIFPEGGLAPDPERDKPAYAIGTFTLKVKPTANTLKLAVASDKPSYEPGQEVTATVQVKDFGGKPAHAEVNLYAVDEGVLMLTAYKTPDLIAAMFRERRYSVLALDTRMHVLGQRKYITPVIKGEEDGGGGGDEQADELRKDFRPVATWVGAVVTDSDGKATHKFKLPDTLTTFRLMAVAVSTGAQFGSGQSEFKVNKTLMIRQALPRFVRPDDHVQAGVVVNHLAGGAQDVTVALEKIDERLFKVSGPRSQTRKVGGKETVAFRFDIKANDAEGPSEIIFAAKMGAFRDRVQLNLPVVRVTPRQSVGISGVVEPGGKLSHTVNVPEGARALSLDVNLSGLPVSALQERMRNLIQYPYGCLEQRTSRIMPLIAVRELAEKLKFTALPTDKIKTWVEEWVTLVPKYRCSDEGFDYYPGCGHGSDPYLTTFALDALVTARHFGYAVPDDLINRAAGYLENQLSGMRKGAGASWDGNAAGLAGALRVLAELERSKPGYENTLYEGRAKLPLFAKADLVRAIYRREKKQTPVVDTLLREITSRGVSTEGMLKWKADDPERYWWAWDSDQRATAVVLRAMLEVVPDDARVPLAVRGLVDIDSAETYWVTQGMTQSLLALAEAAAHLKTEAAKASVTVNTKSLLSAESIGDAVKAVTVAGKDLGTTAITVDLGNSGKGPLFFGGFLQFGYPATARLPAEKEGFSVTRTYTKRDGKPLGDRVKVGEYVQVNLVITADEHGRMVVVEDPLPAGLEPVDLNLATSNSEMAEVMDKGRDWSWWRSRYSEMRDDRVEYHFREIWSYKDYPIRLSYLTRAVTPGTYYAPGTHVERMYQPHIRGRAEGRALVVE